MSDYILLFWWIVEVEMRNVKKKNTNWKQITYSATVISGKMISYCVSDFNETNQDRIKSIQLN